MLDYLDVGGQRVADTSTRSVTRVVGLLGLPLIRGVDFDRPENDGGVEPYAQYLSPKTVTINGEFWGADVPSVVDDFGDLLQTLETAANADTLLKWRPAGDARDLQMTARFIGDCQPILDAVDGNQPILRYQAQFRCADPRAYSQTLQSSSTGAPSANGGMPLPIVFPIPFGAGVTGGSIVASNAGKTVTWPTFTLIGPCNGPVFSVGGYTLTFASLSLGAGQILIVETNPRFRSATVAGASVMGSLRFADSVFAGLLPGVATNVGFSALGGGTTAETNLTVAWRDAYLA